MKKLVKRVMAAMLVVALMTPTLAVNAFESEIVDEFVTEVYELNLNQREEFVDLLKLFVTVDNPDEVADLYARAFAVLAPSQQERLNSFGATVTAASVAANYIADVDYSMDNLEEYLGLVEGIAPSSAAFQAAIMEDEASFEAKLVAAGVSIDDLEDGFSRMGKMFELLSDARLLRTIVETTSIAVFSADGQYGDFTVNEENALKVISVANEKIADDIEDTDSAIAAFKELANYYNELEDYDGENANDKSVVYDYLDTYALVAVVSTTPDEPDNNDDNNDDGPTTAVIVADETPLGLSDLADDEFVQLSIATIENSTSDEDIMTLIEQIMAIINDPLAPVSEVEAMNAFSIVLAGYQKVEDPTSLGTLDVYLTTVLARLSDAYEPFTDLGDYPWAEGYIELLHQAHVIKGVTDTEFAPSLDISRAEFVALLVRMFELTDQGGEFTFTDVPEDEWYYEAVKIAYSNGIINGHSATVFAPTEPITREDMSTVIAKCLALIGTPEATITELPFTDAADVSPWALDYVLVVYENEIIIGDTDGSFRPLDNATRAEAATMLYKVYLMK